MKHTLPNSENLIDIDNIKGNKLYMGESRSRCSTALENVMLTFADGWVKSEVKSALADFISIFQPVDFAKNEHFVLTGDKSNRLGFVCDGVFRTYHSSLAGSEYTKTFFTENTFIAPLAALHTKKESPISLQALTGAKLLVCNYDELESLYSKHHLLENVARLAVEHEGLEKRIPWYYIAAFLGITPVALSRIKAKKAAHLGWVCTWYIYQRTCF